MELRLCRKSSAILAPPGRRRERTFAHTSAMHVSIAIGVTVTFLTLLEIWLAHDPDFVRDAQTPQT